MGGLPAPNSSMWAPSAVTKSVKIGNIAAMSETLNCIEQEPAGEARCAVIWMHGLGATAHDFESVPPELGLPADLAVRYVFPQAPSIPVTLNGGMVMPAWYDILSLGTGTSGRSQDEPGIRRSESQIRALVDREVERGIEPSKIVLAGFSQGGAMALHTALRYPERLAGVMVLSAYLLLHDQLESEASPANRDLPVFQAHGSFDPMVRLEWAEMSRKHLEDVGWAVEWNLYPMAHQVCLEEIQSIGRWLTKVLT